MENNIDLTASLNTQASSQIGDFSRSDYHQEKGASSNRSSPTTSESPPSDSGRENALGDVKLVEIGDKKEFTDPELRKGGFSAFLRRNASVLLKLSLMILLIVGLIVVFFVLAKLGYIEKFLVHVKKLGKLVLLIVGVGEIIAGFPIPNLYSLLAIFGGFCYGDHQKDFWQVWLVAWAGAMIGYSIAFLFSRRFLRDRVKRMMEKEFSFFSDVEDLIELQAWKFVFLLRFTPIPFGILNVILSTTNIPTHVFIIGGILPCAIQTALFSYLGTTLKDISQAISSSHKKNGVQIAVIVIEVVATVLVIVIVGLIGRKAWKNLQLKKELMNSKRVIDGEKREEIDENGFVTVQISTPETLKK